MGNLKSKQALKVGTLNYSGIMRSPYEYYDKEDSRQIEYSRVFEEVVSQKYPQFSSKDPNKFSWKMGKTGKLWQDRYNPIFHVKCGVNQQTKKMMSEDEFVKKWHQVLKQSETFLKQIKSCQSEEDYKKQLANVLQFDLFCYQAIHKVIYGNLPHENKTDAKKYIEQRQKLFNKSFLNERLKNYKTIEAIQQGYDVYFIQEASQNFIKAAQKGKFAEQYTMIRNQGTDSLIFFKNKIFGKLDYEELNNSFLQTYASKRNKSVKQISQILNFNGDSVFQAIGKLLFFNIHLSSKKQINEKQKANLKQDIQYFKKLMPKYSLICGGDLNTQLEHQFQFHTFGKVKINVYPNCETQITANKKRTSMQEQRHKAEQHNFQAKDFLFSDLQMFEAKVQLINGTEIKKNQKNKLLPAHDHPYDHYSVSGFFKIPKDNNLVGQQFCRY